MTELFGAIETQNLPFAMPTDLEIISPMTPAQIRKLDQPPQWSVIGHYNNFTDNIGYCYQVKVLTSQLGDGWGWHARFTKFIAAHDMTFQSGRCWGSHYGTPLSTQKAFGGGAYVYKWGLPVDGSDNRFPIGHVYQGGVCYQSVLSQYNKDVIINQYTSFRKRGITLENGRCPNQQDQVYKKVDTYHSGNQSMTITGFGSGESQGHPFAISDEAWAGDNVHAIKGDQCIQAQGAAVRDAKVQDHLFAKAAKHGWTDHGDGKCPEAYGKAKETWDNHGITLSLH